MIIDNNFLVPLLFYSLFFNSLQYLFHIFSILLSLILKVLLCFHFLQFIFKLHFFKNVFFFSELPFLGMESSREFTHLLNRFEVLIESMIKRIDSNWGNRKIVFHNLHRHVLFYFKMIGNDVIHARKNVNWIIIDQRIQTQIPEHLFEFFNFYDVSWEPIYWGSIFHSFLALLYSYILQQFFQFFFFNFPIFIFISSFHPLLQFFLLFLKNSKIFFFQALLVFFIILNQIFANIPWMKGQIIQTFIIGDVFVLILDAFFFILLNQWIKSLFIELINTRVKFLIIQWLDTTFEFTWFLNVFFTKFIRFPFLVMMSTLSFHSVFLLFQTIPEVLWRSWKIKALKFKTPLHSLGTKFKFFRFHIIKFTRSQHCRFGF